MKVSCDAVAVREDIEFTHLALGTGKLPGQRRLVGESGHHVELLTAEGLRPGASERYQNARDSVARTKRQHQGAALRQRTNLLAHLFVNAFADELDKFVPVSAHTKRPVPGVHKLDRGVDDRAQSGV